MGPDPRKREFPRVGTLVSPYTAYRDMVKKRFPEKMDESRLDAAIALYMRCAGYTRQEVANEVFRHAPARPVGQNRDERIEYGRRVVWYAFGTAGVLILPMCGLRRKIFKDSTEKLRTWSAIGYITKHAKGGYVQPSDYDDFPAESRCFFSLDCLRSARRKPEKEHGHETFDHGLAIALAVVLLLASDAR